MATTQEQIVNLQAEVEAQLEELKLSVSEVDEGVGELRLNLHQTTMDLRSEIEGGNQVAQNHTRKLSDLATNLQRGLKETLERVASEQTERERAMAKAQEATESVSSSVQDVFGEMRSVVTKTEIRIKAEAAQRTEGENTLRAEIAAAAQQAARDRQAMAAMQSQSLVEAERRLDSAIDEATKDTRNEIRACEIDTGLQLQNQGEELSREIQRVEMEVSQRLSDITGDQAQDISQKIILLQEETSSTLVGFREHMDNEFEVHAPISKSTNLYLASTNTDPLTF